MTTGGLVREAAGSAASCATAETCAAALADEPDAGSAEDIVHGTVPRVREVWRSELLVRAEDDYRHRHLPGAPFAVGWTRP